jgi:hypothetical protein
LISSSHCSVLFSYLCTLLLLLFTHGPDWPWPHRVAPASVASVLGLKMDAPTPALFLSSGKLLMSTVFLLWVYLFLYFWFLFSFFFKIYFINICKYTVAVFRHSRRGSQILLRVVAGIWTLDLRKSSRVLLPTEPSHQPLVPFFKQGFSVQPWLSWDTLCRPGWPQTQKSACLCLPSAGIKGVCHHAQLNYVYCVGTGALGGQRQICLKLEEHKGICYLTGLLGTAFRYYERAVSANNCWANSPAPKNKSLKIKLRVGGWRDGPAVKSTDCSSRGPEFNSQQPHGGSQPSAMGSNALFWCVSEDSYSVLTYIKYKSGWGSSMGL